jgi:DNA helicase II / ATP-dependent DNA helicase PcrA
VQAEAILEGLNDAQRRAVSHPTNTLVIEAGAGSGKTRVLTRRIAYRCASAGLDPRHMLAITFTRKAAGELAHRLRDLGLRDTVTAGTFHAVAFAQLRSRWADRNQAPPTVLDRKVGFVARLLPPRCEASPLEVVSEIEWAKARLVAPSQYSAVANAEGRRTPLPASTIGDIYQRYEAEKRRRRLVDLDDLLRLCCHELQEDREFAAAQQWRHRHLFVDEFQDVNPLQYALLRAWLGGRDDVTVVGDPNQAIYGWNGADAHFLADFADEFPDAETVVLDHNYRSSPQILAVASAVLAGPDAPVGLRANRPEGPVPSIRAFDDDRTEAQGVARAVRDRHGPGQRWSAQAVLVRTHAQAALVEDAMHAAGIPFRLRGGRALADEPEVKKALRTIARTRASFMTAVEEFAASLGDATDDASERHGLLQAVVRMAGEYAATEGEPTVVGFEAWLRDTTGGDAIDPNADAVEISTFHAAKGLEWPIVHLAGLEQGLVPIGHAKTPDAVAEERRLLYVAVTRAEQELHITWARERTFGTRTVRRQPSPHLDEIDAAVARLEGRVVRTPRRGKFFDDQRAKLRAVDGGAGRAARDAAPDADLSPADREVFAALKEWRMATARAANVPAYVVFNDRTLADVARRRPRTRDELLAISGIGPVKVGRYGDALLRAVRPDRVG